jgi:hypothetical protein
MVFEVITNYYLLGSIGKNLHTTVFAKYLCKVDEFREKYMLFLRPFRENRNFTFANLHSRKISIQYTKGYLRFFPNGFFPSNITN